MPFEQYAKYVASQGYNINMIVTEMKFDSDSESPKLIFKPVGFLNREQWEVAKVQGSTPEAKSAVIQTASQADSKQKAIAAPVAALEVPKAEVTEPVKKTTKKTADAPAPKADLASVMADWATDDE